MTNLFTLFLFLVSTVSAFGDTISQINVEVNKNKFVPDAIAYKKKDHWASPEELAAYGGDCEDFVIAKYARLLKEGFKKQDMMFLYSYSETFKEKHMVLAVKAGNEWLILDNNTDKPLPMKERTDLVVLYGLSTSELILFRDNKISRRIKSNKLVNHLKPLNLS